eukprot:scaffold128222_cov27-Attheya_sp.AAC.1
MASGMIRLRDFSHSASTGSQIKPMQFHPTSDKFASLNFSLAKPSKNSYRLGVHFCRFCLSVVS